VIAWLLVGFLAAAFLALALLTRPAQEALGQELVRVRDERDEARRERDALAVSVARVREACAGSPEILRHLPDGWL
jgi:F0F1-type ATP synthase membrane subunit b/b'